MRKTISLLLLISCSCLGQTIRMASHVSPTGDLSRGLIGWWTFDAKDAIDVTNLLNRATGGSQAFQINMGSTNYTAGLFGRTCMAFDGSNDRIQLENLAFNPLALTISAWVYLASNTAGRVFGGLDSQNAVVMQISGGGVRGIVGGNNTGFSQIVGSTTAVPLATWTHCAMVFDGATLKMYTNGVLKSTDAAVTQVIAYSQRYSAGCQAAGVGDFYNGRVQEMRVYNRALAAGEVLALYGNAGANASGIDNLTPAYTPYTSPRPQVFYDHDYESDSGDIVDSVVLLTLEKQGYLDIIGSAVESTNIWAAGAWYSVLNYYNRTNMTVGVNTNTPDNSQGTFAQAMVGPPFGVAGHTNGYTQFEDHVTTMRRALAAASDHSVEFFLTAGPTGIKNLLASAGDGFSALGGSNLVALKVRDLFTDGPKLPSQDAPAVTGQADWGWTATSAFNSATMMSNWPPSVPIIFGSYFDGQNILSGAPAMDSLNTNNPARFGYLFGPFGNPVPAQGGAGTNISVGSWGSIVSLPIAFGIIPYSNATNAYSYLGGRDGQFTISGTTGVSAWNAGTNNHTAFLLSTLSWTNYARVINPWIKDP